MVEEEIERSAVDEILKDVKKNVESSTTIATIVPGLNNINKRLLSGELVSTLRHPIRRPAVIKNRRFVGLDDDDFSDEERKQKWKKIKDGIGHEYDPHAEYIYDARKYFDPDKYRTVCANRRKKADKVAEIETEADRNYEQIVAYYSGYYPYCLPGGFEPLGVPPASEWKHQSTKDGEGSQGPEEVVYERFQGKDHYPPRATDLYPPRVTEDYPPRVTKDYPPRVTEDYPPRVTEDYPPRVTEDYPPRVTEDYPPKASSVTEDYPPRGETYYPPRGIIHYPPRGATYYPPRGRDHYLQRGRDHYPPRSNEHYPPQDGEYFQPRGGGRYSYRGGDTYSQQARDSYRTEGWPSERGVVPEEGNEQGRGARGHGRSPRGGRGAWRFARGSHYGGGWSGEGRSGWQLEGRRTGFVTDSESDDENRRLYGDTYHDGDTAARRDEEYKERKPSRDKYNDSNLRARYPRRDTTPQERYPTEHSRDRYRFDNDSSSYNRDKDTGPRHRGDGENKESDRHRDNVMGSRDSYLPKKRGRDDENDRFPRDRLYEEIPQKRTRGNESDDRWRANDTNIYDRFRGNDIRKQRNSADARKYIPRGSVSPTNDRRPLTRANERQTNLQSSKITKTIKRPTNLISASKKILERNKILKDKPSNADRSQSQRAVQELRKRIHGSSSRGASDLNNIRSCLSPQSDNTATKRAYKHDIKLRGMYSDREQPRGKVSSTSESFDLRSFVKGARGKSSTAVAAKPTSSIINDRKRVLPQRKEKDDCRLEPVSRPVRTSDKNEVRDLKTTTNQNSGRDAVKSAQHKLGTASRMVLTNKRVELDSDEESDDTGSDVSDNEPTTKRVTLGKNDVRAKEKINFDDERPKKIVVANDNQRIGNVSVKEIQNLAVKNIKNVTDKNIQSMKRVVYNSDFEQDDDEDESSEGTDEDTRREESDSDDDDVDNEETDTDDEGSDAEGSERSDSEASSQC